jgi:hypothetical protein
MGRPRLSADQRRSLRLAVRLSASDLDELEARKAAVETLCGHVRSKALRRTRPDPVPEVNRIALRLLNEHGQRINDQAHAAHLGATVTITAKQLAELAALLRRILQDLRR